MKTYGIIELVVNGLAPFQSEEAIIVPADALAGPRQGHWTYTEYTALPADGRRIVGVKLA